MKVMIIIIWLCECVHFIIHQNILFMRLLTMSVLRLSVRLQTIRIYEKLFYMKYCNYPLIFLFAFKTNIDLSL